MKLFIWKYVCNLTDRKHHEGGLVMISDSLVTARKLLKGRVPENCEAFTLEPDEIYDFGDKDQPETIHIFPDTGCC